MPRREPPPLETVEYADVLAHYGQTMLCVQKFESTFQTIREYHRTLKISSNSSGNSENFERILDKKYAPPSIDKVRNDILSEWKKLGLSPFPKQAETFLQSLVPLRNRLAHNYLIENARLLKSVEGRKHMIAELRWYSEVFLTMSDTVKPFLDILTDHMGKHFGFDREDLDLFEAEYGPAMEQVSLQNLRDSLTHLGIELSDPPA